jgi:hypothetical protein
MFLAGIEAKIRIGCLQLWKMTGSPGRFPDSHFHYETVTISLEGIIDVRLIQEFEFSEQAEKFFRVSVVKTGFHT